MIAEVHQTAVGAGSGVPVEMTVFYLLEVRDGRAVRFHIYARSRGGARRDPLNRLPRAMAVKTEAVGKSWDPASFEVEAERIAAVRRRGRRAEPGPPRRRGRPRGRAFATSSRRRCSRSSTAPGDGARAILDPEVGMNIAAMVHGGQEFEWGEPVCAGDTITTAVTCKEIYERDGKGFYVFESVSTNQDGERDRARRPGPTSSAASEERAMAEFEPGDAIPELRVTPDAGLTKRYAEASGDPNPIHIDEEFAKSVGLPGLHPARPLVDGPGRPRPHRRSPTATRAR